LQLLELIKQRLSIEKLKQRNIDFINSQLMGKQMNIEGAMAHHNQRLQLPLLFLEIPQNAQVKISQDESKVHLRLQCDKIFVLRDENALL